MQNSGKGTKASRSSVPSKVKESDGSISHCKHFHKTVFRKGRGSKVGEAIKRSCPSLGACWMTKVL